MNPDLERQVKEQNAYFKDFQVTYAKYVKELEKLYAARKSTKS